ncbi:phenylalanine--tRNA ligase subunit beta [Adhaeretor mobilis]|uniref:Phenylalanine--tRNA ligase beta subunit n=1 Tax=Adhaeretor mobilis TaxID=1930276 RepID=A0A517MRY7_9BACT|nr:phenylalanine--tRNA ligase subunit beta [Adhaeretor mobilis]QDS97640.1 Phenylalanine--tRNA ligase beta subunit [Adhaeretor mobilis]
MIVSLDWLKEYVELPKDLDELTLKLTLTGLNLEGVEQVGSDTGVDLEVTSNRPDCLGHIGVAREVAVIWDRELKVEEPQPKPTGQGGLGQLEVECPQLCPRYTARLIRGVKVGPSPEWLANRLRTLGIAVINNVVDITNYVLFECGQPLHAFDVNKLSGAKLADKKIVVRESTKGEKFTAIDHKEYELAEGTCVIADGEKAVALAGVMGGADTEVSEATVDVLIEAADFAPLSVRNTARRHHLHSPSSYRFERGVDPLGIDWASRRACELILELAGGELCETIADSGETYEKPEPVKLRFEQIKRVLGIAVPVEQVQKILTDLGCEETHICDHCIKVIAPSWRADLTREIDLIEEVARIFGYEQIPEDAGVRMVASQRTQQDRVQDRIRMTLVAAGFYEAMTLSAVDETTIDAIQPWSQAEPLRVSTPVLRRADCLRQTLVPSLLASRLHNEKASNPTIELFEIANVYLPQSGELPQQKRLLAITSGGGYLELKGVVEAVVGAATRNAHLEVTPADFELLDSQRSGLLQLDGKPLGYVGELSDAGLERSELRHGCSVAEIDVDLLIEAAQLVVTAEPLSPYPAVSRDLNIVVDESVCWADVERLTATAGGELLEAIEYQETYRDPKRLEAGKKSLLFSVQLRSDSATLTSEQADAVRDSIVAALKKEVGGELRA